VTPSNVDAASIVAVDLQRAPKIAILAWQPDARLRIHVTHDWGSTWTALELPGTYPDGIGSATVTFVDDTVAYVAVTLPSSSAASVGVLLRTANGGGAWTTTDLPVGGPIEFTSRTDGWLAGGPLFDQLYRTTDGGQTWHRISVDVPSSVTGHRAALSLPTVLGDTTLLPVRLVATDGPLLLATYVARNGSSTFSQLGEPVKLADDGDFAAVGIAHGHLMAAAPTAGGFVTSTDDGRSYTKVMPIAPDPASVVKLDVLDDGRAWLLTRSSGCTVPKADCNETTTLWSSADDGLSWAPLDPDAP
jgi:photosystem II stability/assembly factor-like uncharacterized protein